MKSSDGLVLAAWVCFALTMFILLSLAAQRVPQPRPVLGHRGLQRARALSEHSAFAAIEPLARYLASWFAQIPAPRLRRLLTRQISESGDYLGLSDDELLATSAITGVSAGFAMTVMAGSLSLPYMSALPAGLLGALVPPFRVRSVGLQRAKRVTRALPATIELAAMCMEAGLDFPRALRRIVQSTTNTRLAIVEELGRVLQELELGRTRRAAMSDLSKRIPSDEVRELVNSVIQSEEKGTPLARVLLIQARTLRLRRSIAAEETASEAALMLVGPMSLIFLCVIALLLGPVLLRVTTEGLGSV